MIDLANFLRPGSGVWWTQAGGEPTPLVHALMDQVGSIGPIEAFVGLTWDTRLTRTPPDELTVSSFGGLGHLRRLSKIGRLHVIPTTYAALPGMFAQGRLPADVGLIQVSPADSDGLHSLGIGVDYAADAVRHTPILIAEVNEQMPATRGSVRLAPERFAAVLNTNRSLLEAPAVESLAEELAIGQYVAGLVEDGDTIQIGVGRVAPAVLQALGDHRDLGVHTGMITDEVLDLIQQGVVTGARKEIDRGVTVTGAALGSKRLYECVGDFPVEFQPVSRTHATEVLARLRNFVAISSAIQVDLGGHVGAEIRNGVYVGAAGGQVDFARAASSTGARSIVALRSTHNGASTIVPDLGGNPVTTAPSEVDFVVTEHGVAALSGVEPTERARRLTAIAAPQYRDQLERSTYSRR